MGEDAARCGAAAPEIQGVIRKEFCMGAVDRKNVKMLAEGLLLAAIGFIFIAVDDWFFIRTDGVETLMFDILADVFGWGLMIFAIRRFRAYGKQRNVMLPIAIALLIFEGIKEAVLVTGDFSFFSVFGNVTVGFDTFTKWVAVAVTVASIVFDFYLLWLAMDIAKEFGETKRVGAIQVCMAIYLTIRVCALGMSLFSTWAQTREQMLYLVSMGSSLLFWYQLMALRLELFRHAEEKTSEEV